LAGVGGVIVLTLTCRRSHPFCQLLLLLLQLWQHLLLLLDACLC
jgi:hypothetical protein